MYHKINTRAGTVLIFSKIIEEIEPLLAKSINYINKQETSSELLAFVVDVFSEEFQQEYQVDSKDLLSKYVVSIINARHYMIEDKDDFCLQFNEENVGFEIGFDKGFYPVEQGHWYSVQEFVITDVQEECA